MGLRRVAANQITHVTDEYAVAGEAFNRAEFDGLGRLARGNGLIAPVIEPLKSIMLVGTSLTLSTQLAADAFLANNNAHIHPVDLAGVTQARLTGRVTTVGAAGSKVQARFRAGAFSTVITDYLIMGATSVEIGLAATGIIDSGWIELVTAAKVNGIFLGVMSIGGDGVASPIIANLRFEVR